VNIRFDGKTAIVTGSASGIGRGIARCLAESGANVVIADVALDKAKATAAEIENDFPPVGALAVKTDITKQASVDRMVARAVKKFGGVHVLVNNAGLSNTSRLVDMTDATWNAMLTVNLTGTMRVSKTVVTQMLEQGGAGAIINISSKSGCRGSASASHYCATKFGVIGMAQSWAREYAADGIRCCSVLPGNVFEGSAIWSKAFIKQQAKKHGLKPDQVVAHYNAQVPLGRSCTVEDIANTVTFLASDQASYLTGISVLVDGGQEMR